MTISGVPPFANHIAFDNKGNLWAADPDYFFKPDSTSATAQGRLLEYAASSLTTSGSPAPAVTLMLPAGALPPLPTAVAFDNSGDLWYIDLNNAYVGELKSSQISASGSPKPTVSLTNPSPSFFGVGLTFSPHPPNIPLQ